jgi:alkyl hydroperoxide reductase subunit D
MSLKDFSDSLPDYARDIRSNVEAILRDESLNDQRKYGLLLACAHGTGYKPIVGGGVLLATPPPAPAHAARGAAAVMAMTNVYFRFVHLASNHEYAQMPARLRMNLIGSPGIAKVDFELFGLAVSAMNGCGLCIDSHEKMVRQHNVGPEVVQAAARIAAVLKAAATVHATAV